EVSEGGVALEHRLLARPDTADLEPVIHQRVLVCPTLVSGASGRGQHCGDVRGTSTVGERRVVDREFQLQFLPTRFRRRVRMAPASAGLVLPPTYISEASGGLPVDSSSEYPSGYAGIEGRGEASVSGRPLGKPADLS